jgi:trans-aconitate methyltransferase
LTFTSIEYPISSIIAITSDGVRLTGAGRQRGRRGCGPTEALRLLPPDIHYFGFDLSPDYIEAAKRNYGNRGRFRCADVTQLAPGEIPPCDVAVAFGVLHHLDDDGAKGLIDGLHARLASGGG